MAQIRQHINSMKCLTIRSVVERAVYRFQLVEENGGQYVENSLGNSSGN